VVVIHLESSSTGVMKNEIRIGGWRMGIDLRRSGLWLYDE
jgi:hypothetical protein